MTIQLLIYHNDRAHPTIIENPVEISEDIFQDVSMETIYKADLVILYDFDNKQIIRTIKQRL